MKNNTPSKKNRLASKEPNTGVKDFKYLSEGICNVFKLMNKQMFGHFKSIIVIFKLGKEMWYHYQEGFYIIIGCEEDITGHERYLN